MTKTSIEWTDETWNPVTGCDKVSPGCDNCYAEGIANRFAGTPQFPNGFGVTLRPDRLDQPFHWRKPRRVFVNSMSDLFHDDVPDEFIARVWMTMHIASEHTFQILTKRPGRMRSWVERWTSGRIPHPDTGHAVPGRVVAPNIWLGVSAENQHWANVRIPLLLDTPAAVRFLSAEPLLGPIDIFANSRIDRDPGLDWVIVGGESGRGARPMHPNWVRMLGSECDRTGIAFLFKQWGEWAPLESATWPMGDVWANPQRHRWVDHQTGESKPFGAFTGVDDSGWALMHRVGKKVAGRELDGRTWDQFPAVS